jgi:Lar family restriction alleviation protein
MTTTQAEERELLPCPFCGGDAQTDFIEHIFSYLIECYVCDAQGPICETKEEAIAAWNTRAAASIGDQQK